MLQGKSALITGSTSGIGLGIAEMLAQEGVNLVLNGFGNVAEIEAIRAGLAKKYSVRVQYSPADMTKPEQIRSMVNEAERAFGAVDILVNNAGIQHVETVETYPEAKWDAIIAINLSASFHTIKAAIPGMKRKSWGRIINIASVHGLVASAFKPAYIAAKHGLVGLTKAVCMDVSPYGVTCNAICPGYVNTPLVQRQIPEQAKMHHISESEVVEKVMLKEHAIKQFVEIEQVAALALFLCSDSASSITGTALPIDGGWSAH